jgi:hypothetical protein
MKETLMSPSTPRAFKKPSEEEIKAIQEVISINATERLSIVGFYGAIFVGIIYSMGNLNPLYQCTNEAFSTSIVRTGMGFILTFIGILVNQILRKYNYLIKIRSRILEHPKVGWRLLNEHRFSIPGKYDSKYFSIRNLLSVIMAFFISMGVFVLISGLTYFVVGCNCEDNFSTFYIAVPTVASILIFLLIISVIRRDNSIIDSMTSESP